MPTLVNLQTGENVDVPTEGVFDALSTGKFNFAPGTMVHMTAPDGQTFQVRGDTKDVWTAKQKGFTFESPAAQLKRKSELDAYWAGGKGGAILAGGARGLTAGLSDVLLSQDEDVKQGLQALEKQYPTESMVSEIGGMVGGAFVPAAPAGAIAKAGMGIERAIARGIASKVGETIAKSTARKAAVKGLGAGTAGMVEGVLFGTGKALSEAELGDHELNSEFLVPHLVLSAGLGFGAGAGLAGLAGGARTLQNALRGINKGSDDAGATMIREIVSEGGGSPTIADRVSRLYAGLDDRLGPMAHRKNRELWLSDFNETVQSRAKVLRQLMDEADEAAAVGMYGMRTPEVKYEKIAPLLEQGGNYRAAADDLNRLVNELDLDGMIKNPDFGYQADLKKVANLVRKTQGRLGSAEKSLAEGKISELQALGEVHAAGDTLKRQMQLIERKMSRNMDIQYLDTHELGQIQIGGGLDAHKIKSYMALRNVEDPVRLHLENAKFYGEGGNAQRAINEAYHEFLRRATVARLGVHEAAITAKGEFGNIWKPVQSKIEGKMKAFGTTPGDEWIAKFQDVYEHKVNLLNKIDEYGFDVSEMYPAGMTVKSHLERILKTFDEHVGDITMLNKANEAMKQEGLIPGVKGLAAGYFVGGAPGAAIGAAAESITKPASTLYRLTALETMVARQKAKISEAVGKFTKFVKTGKPAKMPKLDLNLPQLRAPAIGTGLEQAKEDKWYKTKYGQIAKALREIAVTPEKLEGGVSEVFGPLEDFAPNHAMASSMSVARVVSALADVLPTSVGSEFAINPLKSRGPVNPEEKLAFERAVRVAADPDLIWEQLAAGYVDIKSVQLYEMLYPARFEEAKQTMIAQLSELDVEPSQEHKNLLWLTFNIPLDYSHAPGAQGRIQANFMASQKGEGGVPPSKYQPKELQGSVSSSEASTLDADDLNLSATQVYHRRVGA